MAFTGKFLFVYMAHHFTLLRLNPFDLRSIREGWWFQHTMSQLWVCSSAENAKKASWPWLSLLRGWGKLTMAFTVKFFFLYMAHHFILLQLNSFDLRVFREGWWFEHSMSQLWACLSTEDAENVSWPLLYPLQGWSILTMAFTIKCVFVYMVHHFILLGLNPFDLRVVREGWWFEYSVS